MNLGTEPVAIMGGKLEELILFVAQATEKDERCCAAKLDKILFYADFRAYDHLGRSITGRRYLKREGGPVPEGVSSVVETMGNRGWCAWREQGLTALREPDLGIFAPEELEITRAVVRD